MNKKKIVILSVVLVLLAVVLAVVMNLPDNDSAEPGSDQLQTDYNKEYIYSASMDSISKITASVSGDSYTLEKNGTGWQRTDNSNVQMSQASILGYLTSLHSVSYADKIEDGNVSVADCGIDDSSDTVTFECNLGSITIRRGSNVSDSDLCYMQTSLDDCIYMVEQSKINSLFVPFSKFRNESIERIDFENIESVELVNSICSINICKGEYNIDKGYYYSWRMTAPISALARDSEIDGKIINPIKKIDLSESVSDSGDFENYGLSSKNHYITLTDSYGEKQTIYFSDKIDNGYYICIDSDLSVYRLSVSDAPFASVAAIDIADRQVYLTKQVNLKTVEIKGTADYKVEFADDYVTVNGRKKDSETDIRDTFSAICGILADDVSTAPIGAPQLTITYSKKDGTSTVVEFADADDRYWFVAKDGVPMYKILKSKLDSLFKILDK